MEREMCEVREQKAFHSPFRAVRGKPKPSVCFFLPGEVSETACHRAFLPLFPDMEIFMLCFNESRHIWEKGTSWNHTGFVKRSAILCIFLKAFLWKLLVLVNKVIFREEEQMQACDSHLDRNTTWSQRETKHQTQINCDRWLLSISLWWEPDFSVPLIMESLPLPLLTTKGSPYFHQTPHHLLSSWFFYFCSYNPIITLLPLWLPSPSRAIWPSFQCLISGKYGLVLPTSPQQGTKTKNTLFHNSWRFLNPNHDINQSCWDSRFMRLINNPLNGLQSFKDELQKKKKKKDELQFSILQFMPSNVHSYWQ